MDKETDSFQKARAIAILKLRLKTHLLNCVAGRERPDPGKQAKLLSMLNAAGALDCLNKPLETVEGDVEVNAGTLGELL